MSNRKMIEGVCRLCKKNTQLSYEHVPPKSAFNRNTKFISVSIIEYLDNSDRNDFKLNAKIQQGGVGYYCLCRKCNSFLGNYYVRSYQTMASIFIKLLNSKDFDKISLRIMNISHLKFFKQIISMFVCINKSDFTNNRKELLQFIKDPNENIFPDNIRIYMYLNIEGQLRNLSLMYSNHYGLVSELTFPPFGFVLSLSPNVNLPLTDITFLKDFSLNDEGEVVYELLKLKTYLPIPLDYRSRIEIDECIKNNSSDI